MDRKYLKSALGYLLTTVISIIIVVYLIYQFRAVNKEIPEMKIATNEKVDITIGVSGYLFLEEYVLTYEGNGTAISNYTDGAQISAGSVPFSVYSDATKPDAEKAQELLRRIEFLKKCQTIQLGSIDTTGYDRLLKEDYRSLLEACENGELALSAINADNWFMSQTKRQIAIKLSSGYSESIASIQQERDMIIESSGDKTDFVSGCSGAYFNYTDGLEDLLSPDVVSQGHKAVENAISQIKNYYKQDSKDGDGTKTAGKIVLTGKWYYVCPVASNDIADRLEPGKTYTLSFKEDNELKLDMVYEKMLTDFNKEGGFALFSSMTLPEGFSLSRYKSAEIVLESYYGMCIPKTAIRYKDGKAGVYVAVSNKARFRAIDILSVTDGCVIVTPQNASDEDGVKYLALYDTVITSSKELYDGKYIDLTS